MFESFYCCWMSKFINAYEYHEFKFVDWVWTDHILLMVKIMVSLLHIKNHAHGYYFQQWCVLKRLWGWRGKWEFSAHVLVYNLHSITCFIWKSWFLTSHNAIMLQEEESALSKSDDTSDDLWMTNPFWFQEGMITEAIDLSF